MSLWLGLLTAASLLANLFAVSHYWLRFGQVLRRHRDQLSVLREQHAADVEAQQQALSRLAAERQSQTEALDRLAAELNDKRSAFDLHVNALRESYRDKRRHFDDNHKRYVDDLRRRYALLHEQLEGSYGQTSARLSERSQSLRGEVDRLSRLVEARSADARRLEDRLSQIHDLSRLPALVAELRTRFQAVAQECDAIDARLEHTRAELLRVTSERDRVVQEKHDCGQAFRSLRQLYRATADQLTKLLDGKDELDRSIAILDRYGRVGLDWMNDATLVGDTLSFSDRLSHVRGFACQVGDVVQSFRSFTPDPRFVTPVPPNFDELSAQWQD